MIKLRSGYGDLSADDLAHLGETVATNLPTLAIFSILKPTAAEISAAVTALRSAIASTGPGRAQAIKASFDDLAGLLADVATNAPQIPDVTDTDLAAIGLPVVKTRTRETQTPGPCLNFRVRHGANPGEVLAVCDPPGDNIRLYDAQHTSTLTATPGSTPQASPTPAPSNTLTWSAAKTPGSESAPAIPWGRSMERPRRHHGHLSQNQRIPKTQNVGEETPRRFSFRAYIRRPDPLFVRYNQR